MPKSLKEELKFSDGKIYFTLLRKNSDCDSIALLVFLLILLTRLKENQYASFISVRRISSSN